MFGWTNAPAPVCIADEGLPFGPLAVILLVAHPGTAVLCVVAFLDLVTVISTCVREESSSIYTLGSMAIPTTSLLQRISNS